MDPITDALPYTEPHHLIEEFASRGLVLLSPESLGISPDIHDRIYEQEKRAYHDKRPVTPSSIPDVLELLDSPGLVSACNQIVGENWAIVPFTHNASFTSGSRDQHWHKDDNGPYNSRKQRHHQAVQVEMLYYPQDVHEDMGPTATIPYSQYWTYNHEENQDNFAGADHLDFEYHLSHMERVPVSGPDSNYDVEDIINQRTAHDIRMRESVTNTGWPLMKQLEAGPLRAGSVLLYSHNTFHRGNHRRDDWRTWKDHPRFMWRFWLYRTTDAPCEVDVPEASWSGVDPLTNTDLDEATDDTTTVWRYHNYWMRTGQAPPPRPDAIAATPEERQQETDNLFAQLHATGDEKEPERIGAAYKLASIGDSGLAVGILSKALYDDRESVRRAATYGLIAVGPDATDTLIEASNAPTKWVRKAGVYALGDVSPLTTEVLKTVTSRLENDQSVYVRSVAAGTLGCLGRRAVATDGGVDLIPACLEALVGSLDREENRPAMDKAQGRSIKFVRPTDVCDVCEGGAVTFGKERFRMVRSAVRENALWAIVILCSHGAKITGDSLDSTIKALRDVVRHDKNVICVGFALDALNRLVHLHKADGDISPRIAELRSDLVTILGETPVRGWEALVRGELSSDVLSEFIRPAE
ncbi:MAG: HEAT repeat domain-containing protein [Candidatus Latescibacterota bacterium]|nr:HEAT repeat domain-containing protein [Candidatus Latescibacterota bacterium]